MYRKHLDSISTYELLPKKEVKRLRDYVGKNRKSIPTSWSYRQINEGRKKAIEMMSDAVGMEVQNLWSRTVKKVVEFRYILKFQNKLDLGISRIRGKVVMLDLDGNVINRSPNFVVAKDLAPGDTIGGLRLEYAYYKPTGNELNDPDNDAFRDSLKWMQAVAASDTSTNFRFKLRDVILENGQTIADYWLTAEAERDAMKPDDKKPLALLKWAEANKDILKAVKKPLSGYFLEVTPVLTDHVEDSHGKWLLFDRRTKVVKFFTTQKKIAGSKINPRPKFARLIKEVFIDFCNWPLELRIYKQ
ncbi:MAG: hypothetical protein AAF570_23485 [Bacteroidota bacterium]